jgi:hypothetical protein
MEALRHEYQDKGTLLAHFQESLECSTAERLSRAAFNAELTARLA